MRGREELEEVAGRLRQAVAAGDYSEAQKVLPEYRRVLEQVLSSVAPASPDANEIARQAADLLGWARRMALASRAHVAAELAKLPVVRRRTPYRTTHHTWFLEG